MTLFEKADNSQELKGFRAKIGEIFSKFGLSPNQWTMLSLVMAFIAAVFISIGQLAMGALLIIISGGIDLIDGAVARHTNRVTKEGAYIDTVADRYAEFLYVLPLMFLSLPGVIISMRAWALIYLAGSFITTYVKAAAKEKELGVSEIKGGIVERAERVGIYVIGLLLGSINPLLLSYVIVILAILVHISALQRIKKTLDAVKDAAPKEELKQKEEVTARVTFEKTGKFDEETIDFGDMEDIEKDKKRIKLPPPAPKKEKKGEERRKQLPF